MAENIIKLTLSEQIYNILKEDILAGTIRITCDSYYTAF